jgi:hypothetical protein
MKLLNSYYGFDLFYNLRKKFIRNVWGLGIGDWGLGIGDWAQSPIPNPQSPIPNPQSPIPKQFSKINDYILLNKQILLIILQ